MKRIFQSYKIFSPLWYRLVAFIALPLLAIGNEALGRLVEMPMFALHATVFTAMLIFGDSWVLNGICDKRSISLDFMKSSKYGHKVMNAAILSDMGARLGLCLLVFLVTGLIGGYPLASVTEGLIVFSLGTIGMTITRHFDNIQVMMIIGFVFGTVASAVTSLYFMFFQDCLQLIVTNPVGYILFAAAIAITVFVFVLCSKYTISRVEGTYHDSRS